MTEHTLSFKFQDDLKELVGQLRLTKNRGGFFLLSVSGPLAQKLIEEELYTKLKDEFKLKKILWNPEIRDLIELFPLEDRANTIYIVDGLENSLKEENGPAVYSLLNLTREFYSRRKKVVIYRLPLEILYKELQWKAPDFWSFRTASFEFYLHDDLISIIKEKVRSDLNEHVKKPDIIAFWEVLLETEKKAKSRIAEEFQTH